MCTTRFFRCCPCALLVLSSCCAGQPNSPKSPLRCLNRRKMLPMPDSLLGQSLKNLLPDVRQLLCRPPAQSSKPFLLSERCKVLHLKEPDGLAAQRQTKFRKQHQISCLTSGICCAGQSFSPANPPASSGITSLPGGASLMASQPCAKPILA